MKKHIIFLLVICLVLPLLSGCTKVKDTTVEVDALDIDLTNVRELTTAFIVNQVYESIEDMVVDAKYIVEGTIQDIEYFADESSKTPRTKIDLLVSKSYSGNIKPNTTISIIEHQGYIPVKLYIEDYVKETGKFPSLYTEDDIKNGVVLKFKTTNGVYSKVGDQCLYFLINIETPYSDTNVYGDKRRDDFSPQGAYKPIGILMGKLTLVTNTSDTDYYRHNNSIYISLKDSKLNNEGSTRLVPTIPKDELIAELEECLKSN